jgi:hypothetical protein
VKGKSFRFVQSPASGARLPGACSAQQHEPLGDLRRAMISFAFLNSNKLVYTGEWYKANRKEFE